MKTLGEMQYSLYARAKTEKDAKFNTLMDKICRSDVLKEAWNLVYENRGSPGEYPRCVHLFSRIWQPSCLRNAFGFPSKAFRCYIAFSFDTACSFAYGQLQHSHRWICCAFHYPAECIIAGSRFPLFSHRASLARYVTCPDLSSILSQDIIYLLWYLTHDLALFHHVDLYP